MFVKWAGADSTAEDRGGGLSNVVPGYASLVCGGRDSKRAGVEDVVARVRGIAEGAALAATLADLYEDPAKRAAIRKAFTEKLAGKPCQSYLPPGPPSIPRR